MMTGGIAAAAMVYDAGKEGVGKVRGRGLERSGSKSNTKPEAKRRQEQHTYLTTFCLSLRSSQDSVNASVKIVRHRHGDEAGEAAQDGADAILAVGETVFNVASLTHMNAGKGIAKGTAKKF